MNVECQVDVGVRFFGNFSLAEAAAILGCSFEQAVEEWTVARAWLRRELGLAMAEKD